MGYHIATGAEAGRYADVEALAFYIPAEQSADGASNVLELGDRRVLRLVLDATAVDGEAPTLDVTVECSADGATWYTAGAFTHLAAPGSERIVCPADRFARIAWDVGGEDAGGVGAVVQTGPGPAVTLSGTPEIDGAVLIEIDLGGARGVATFRWSLDDGQTWEAEDVATGASVELTGTGLAAEFAEDEAGALSAITRTGTVGPAIVASGEPDADYDFRVEIDLGGARETATFRWSIDGGQTWEAEDVATPAAPGDIALGATGVSLNFPATVGTRSAVTQTGAGPAITTSGDPDDAYDVRILITGAGGRGVGVFQWSIDDGETWEELDVTIPATPGTHVLGTTGVSVTFADDAFVDGESYRFTTTAPTPYVLGELYDFTGTAPVVYELATTYEATADDPDPDTVATFTVSGEAA